MGVLQIAIDQEFRKNRLCDSPSAYESEEISTRKFQITWLILVKFSTEGPHIMQ
jgi:hypothetical protein